MAIHAFRIDGQVEIWSDCEKDSETDGRCLGSGETFQLAFEKANMELVQDAIELSRLREADVQTPR
jgi:hypothetical protein